MVDWIWLEMGNWFETEPCAASLGTGSGRVSVSGADFLRGLSLGTERDSGASVHIGVEGALAGPVRAQEDKGVSLMEIDGGNTPIFWLVASWMVRSNSLTSSIVMSRKNLQETKHRLVLSVCSCVDIQTSERYYKLSVCFFLFFSRECWVFVILPV